MEAVAEQIAQSPAVSKLIMLLMMALIVWTGRFFYKLVTKNYKSIMQEFKLFNYKIEAMDKALEHSLQNGYEKARNEYFQVLKDNDNFINE